MVRWQDQDSISKAANVEEQLPAAASFMDASSDPLASSIHCSFVTRRVSQQCQRQVYTDADQICSIIVSPENLLTFSIQRYFLVFKMSLHVLGLRLS